LSKKHEHKITEQTLGDEIIMKYFAYGSNMDSDDLSDWCKRKKEKLPQLSNPRVAILEDYKLDFTKYSGSREGGVADIVYGKNEFVYGVVFDVPEDDFRILDKKEGAPRFYKRCIFKVKLLNGEILDDVFTYEIVDKEGFVPPTTKYMDILIKGATGFGLPQIWINKLESFKK